MTDRCEESTLMPTYQYRCTECAHDLEAVQKFTDPALTECPNCSGSLRKVYNAVGVVFKGSGFYRTDSRKAPSEAGASESNGNAAAAAKDGNGAKEKGSNGAKAPAKEPATSSSSSSSAGSSTSSGSSSTGGKAASS